MPFPLTEYNRTLATNIHKLVFCVLREKMANEGEEARSGCGYGGKVIIAMKGHPGTGKSTLARSLASSLKIPLIDKDDIRDCTLSLQQSLSPSIASSLLNDFSYQAIWQIASTQLQLGLSIVIDSPLSRRNHLDRLLLLASSAGARLLVIECKPSDEVEWRRRVESRADSGEGSWHKPGTWGEMERLLESYAGSTEYEVGDVRKLVVDTTAGVGIQEVVSDVLDFIASDGASVGVGD